MTQARISASPRSLPRLARLALLLGALGVLGSLGAPRPAAAAPRRVLVFPLTGSLPGDPAGGLRRLTEVVARAAGLTGARVMQGKASLEDTAALAGCEPVTAECLAQLARSLGVDQVVAGTVAPGAGGRTVAVTLRLQRDGTMVERSFTLRAADLDGMVEELARELPALFVGTATRPGPAPGPTPGSTPAPGPGGAATGIGPAPGGGPPSPARDRGGFRVGRVRKAAWAVAAGGVVLAGAGGWMMGAAAARQDDIDGAPSATVSDLEHLRDLEDDGARYALAGNVLVIGGAAAIVVGGVLVVLQGRAGGAPEASPAVTIAPVPIPGGAGVSLRVRLP